MTDFSPGTDKWEEDKSQIYLVFAEDEHSGLGIRHHHSGTILLPVLAW